MPRRKQGHLQASKRFPNSPGRGTGRHSSKRTSNNEPKLRTIPALGKKGGRSGRRARTSTFRTKWDVSDIAASTSESKTRYLHKKFQRHDCLSMSPSEQSAVSQDNPTKIADELVTSKNSAELHESGTNVEMAKSSKALEALLKVTEMEIIKSSTSVASVSNDPSTLMKVCGESSSLDRLDVNSKDSVPMDNLKVERKVHAKTFQNPSQKNITNPILDDAAAATTVAESVRSADISLAAGESEPKKVKSYRHICTYCNHTFAKPSVLKKHIRAHTNERPFPCELCGFAFKTKSNLYKHCKSRSHSIKITENESCTSVHEMGIATESNGESEDDGEKISDSDNSCDAMTSKVSVPNRDCERSLMTKVVSKEAESFRSSDGKLRVPPIKIQTLMHQTRLVATPNSLQDLDESEKLNPHKVSTDGSQNKNCMEVSTMIYKPKFHSAIIGGSRKFIDYKNFTVESSSSHERTIYEDENKEPDCNMQRGSNDGLMLRVMERSSDSAAEIQSMDCSGSVPLSLNLCENNVNIDSSKALLSKGAYTDAPSPSVSCSAVVYNPQISSDAFSASRNSLKTPRLATPEFLKQHISNLISRNTAIVETLNPLWSRRYLRQSSVASSQNVDAELRMRDKIRHYSHDVQSKYAPAFQKCEGDTQNRQLTGSQSLPATPSVIISAPPFTSVMLSDVKNQLVNLSVTIPPSTPTHLDKGFGLSNSSSSPTGTKVDTVLTSKAMIVGQQSSSPKDDGPSNKEMVGQHPQNPEGSIIKNLLLKKRPSGMSVVNCSSYAITSSTSTCQSPTDVPLAEHVASVPFSPSETSPYPLHTCSVCQTSFRSVETLLAHQSHYCKKNTRSSQFVNSSDLSDVRKLEVKTDSGLGYKGKHPSDGIPKPRGRPKGSKNRPKDASLVSNMSSVAPASKAVAPQTLNVHLSTKYGHISAPPVPYSNETHGKTLDALKGKLSYRHVQEGQEKMECLKSAQFHTLEKADTEMRSKNQFEESLDEGLILKKHLLSGGGDKSPPLKKRKLPDEPLKKDVVSTLSVGGSISTLRSLEELSRCPMRPNVQMFGGEVQICDGTETKKMRIDTKIQHPVSSTGGIIVAHSSSIPVHAVPVISHVSNIPDGNSTSAVIVTIAKPVLNSGGTVMQMHDSKPQIASPVCIPVVALGRPLMASGITSSKIDNLNAAISDHSMSDSRKYNDMDAVVLSGSMSTSLPVMSKEFYSINISHLHINPTSTSSSNTSSLYNLTTSNSSFSQPLMLNYESPSTLISSDVLQAEGDKARTELDLNDFSSRLMVSKGSANKEMSVPCIPSVSIVPSMCESVSEMQDFSSPSESLALKNDGKLEKDGAVTDVASRMELTTTPANEKEKACQMPSIKIQSVSPIMEDAQLLSATTKAVTDEPTKSFLAPPRPTSLPLKLRSCLMGTTLISPETPRPKKKYGQLYLNGQYYTYLGLKCSTRVYYCCIYRPQPMYVPQATDPKLSMYSNWQTVPSEPDPLNLTPAASMACYNSKARGSRYVSAGPKKMQYLLTHSSYWTFKNKNDVTKEKSEVAGISSLLETSSEANVVSDEKVSTNEVVLHEDMSKKSDQPDVSDQDSCASVTSGRAKSKESSETSHDSSKRVKIFEGGFKSNEEYTYVRGRGRGKYICEECGIRCKKPSMLKKHIRTHTDVRPFTCKHCNFSFKTKGNLTKHMKSKAHHKKCVELGIDPIPVTIEETQIDEEALAKQERYEKERAQFIDDDDDTEDYDLDDDDDDDDDEDDDDEDDEDDDEEEDESSEDEATEKKSSTTIVKAVSQSQFDDAVEDVHSSKRKPVHVSIEYPEEHEAAKSLIDLSNHGKAASVRHEAKNDDAQDSTSFAQTHTWKETCERESPKASNGKTRLPEETDEPNDAKSGANKSDELIGNPRVVWESNQTTNKLDTDPEMERSIQIPINSNSLDDFSVENKSISSFPLYLLSLNDKAVQEQKNRESICERTIIGKCTVITDSCVPSEKETSSRFAPSQISLPCVRKQTDVIEEGFAVAEKKICAGDEGQVVSNGSSFDQPIDLSKTGCSGAAEPNEKSYHLDYAEKRIPMAYEGAEAEPPKEEDYCHQNISDLKAMEMYETISPPPLNEMEQQMHREQMRSRLNGVRTSPIIKKVPASWEHQGGDCSSTSMLHAYLVDKQNGETGDKRASVLAARKICQESLTPIVCPKSSEHLATSPQPSTSNASFQFTNQNPAANPSSKMSWFSSPLTLSDGKGAQTKFLLPSGNKVPIYTHRMSDDGKCVCDICDKSFTKPSQLRLHVNIHYFERPFRCDSCAVSFRTKGHLQKHRRSVSHYNKVNMNMTFGTPTTDNPRPFKCIDCKIAFRIHGHLAKHLRSKMHIMKLECLGKLPFGTYAEIERSGANLNEIDTTDCENSLESLQVMAQRLYEKDTRRPRWTRERTVSGCSADDCSDISHITDESLESSRYRSLSLNESGHFSPEYSEVDGRSVADVKQELVDLPASSELYRQDHWNALRQSSMDAMNQEYEDISDAESELDSGMSCMRCGQAFKDVKALHLHVYLEHSESRDPSAYMQGLQVRNTDTACDDPSLTIEMRMNNNHSHNVSVAMEMRRNTLTENAAIALEMRRKKAYIDTLDEQMTIASTSNARREAYTTLGGSSSLLRGEAQGGNGGDEAEGMEPPKMATVRGDCGLAKMTDPLVERTVVFSFSQSSSSSASLQLPESVEIQSYVCDICGGVFNNQFFLQQHMVTHVQLRPFICEICDAGFTSKEHLWHHIASHKQEKEASGESETSDFVNLECSSSPNGNGGKFPKR